MLRKFVCAVVIMGFSLGLALAEDLKGRITKVDGSKLSFKVDKGEAVEYSTTPTTTVAKKDGDAEVKVEDGLKAKVFSKIGDKGIGATITVDGKVISKIVLTPKKAK